MGTPLNRLTNHPRPLLGNPTFHILVVTLPGALCGFWLVQLPKQDSFLELRMGAVSGSLYR